MHEADRQERQVKISSYASDLTDSSDDFFGRTEFSRQFFLVDIWAVFCKIR